jgi:hypothetical protein
VGGSDGGHVSQGQMCAFGMASGSTELGVDGSTLTRSVPPPYKWLWLPARTLDLALGFPATQCDIWMNYKRARSFAPRSVSPGEDSSVAMDRDRQRGKRPYDEVSGGGDRRWAPDLRQKLSREEEIQRRRQREWDEHKREEARLERERDRLRQDNEQQRHPPPPPRSREPPRATASRKPRSGNGASGLGQDQGMSANSGSAVMEAPPLEPSNITYYNCGKLGHFQADCKGEPFCIKCKK